MQHLALAFSRLTLAGGILLLIAGHLAVLPMPHTRDVGVWAYAGWRLLEGDVPYRDFFDHKPPGVFGLYALGELIGRGPVIVRLLDLAGALVATVVLRRAILAVARNVGLADLGAGLFAALVASPQLARGSAQTETVSLGLVVPAYALVLFALVSPESRAMWRFVLAGLLAACAASLRASAVLDAALLFAFVLFAATLRSPARAVAFLAGAVVLPSAYLIYALATASLPHALDAVASFNAAYAASPAPLAHALAAGAAVSAELLPLFAGALAVAATGLASGLTGDRGPAFLLAVAWLGLAAFETVAPLRFFHHYYAYLAAPLCAVAAWLRPSAWRGAAAGLVAVATLLTLSTSALAILQLAPTVEGRLAGRLPTPQERAAAIVARATPADGRAFVWGVEPDVLYLARRRGASRYLYSTVLAYPGAARRYAELLEDLRAHRPEALVLAPEPETGAEPVLTAALCELFAAYRRETSDAFDGWLVYTGEGTVAFPADVSAGRIRCVPERDLIASWPGR